MTNARSTRRAIGQTIAGILIGVLIMVAGALVATGRIPVVNAGLPAFVDVAPGEIGSDAIGAAWRYGYMIGTGPDTFDPDGVATRAQAAVVLVRCELGAGHVPAAIRLPEPGDHWAATWLAEAIDLGLMELDAIAEADAPMTRTDLAMLLVTCGPLDGGR